MAAVDRISELPEFILHRILSSLSQKQSIQTSALSKTWRHVGPTRPKIELRERCFKNPGGSASFLSVLDKTLQRYYDRNLSVHEFIFEMSNYRPTIDSKSRSVLDAGITMLLTYMGVKKFDFSVPHYFLAPSVVFRSEFLTELCLSECYFTSTTTADDHIQPLFKGLKRLSLTSVVFENETLEKIIRTCPLIEYLSLSGCVGPSETIPVTLNLSIFQAEFLAALVLVRIRLLTTTSSTDDQLLSIKRLKTLTLIEVDILDETLEKIMSSCPLIERVHLSQCVGLKNIQLNKSGNMNNLKHLDGAFDVVGTQSVEIDVPTTIETIHIHYCHNLYGLDKYVFLRLKNLYLRKVRLTAELLQSFSSNFPSLEELELRYCYGLPEIQLTLCSVKHLVLIMDSISPIKATIYAPNIRDFELSVISPPQIIFYTEATTVWKSHVVMPTTSTFYTNNDALDLPWLIQLRELVNSLSESEVSLVVFSDHFSNMKVEDTNDAGFCCKPVPVEFVRVEVDYQPSSFADFLNCLFLICRPRYMGMKWYTTHPFNDRDKKTNKLAEFIISKMIRNEGGVRWGCLWKGDLKEISMQVWDENSQGWHALRVEGTSLPGFTSSDPKIRFSLKWRRY